MTLSKTIYFISKLLFFGCLAFVCFVLIGSIFAYFEFHYSVDIPFIEIPTDGNETRIEVPFTKIYVGFQNSYTIILMWFSFIFYAYYFFTLSNFFKVFTEKEIFTDTSLAILKKFLILNLVPLAAAIVFISIELIKGAGLYMNSEYALVLVHLFVGLLVYLYLEVLKKGKLVQDENDLTI